MVTFILVFNSLDGSANIGNTTYLSESGSLWSETVLNLATFLTSLISLLTLNEMRKQRNLTNTPKLHLMSPQDTISIHNKKISGSELELPFEWKSENLHRILEDFPAQYSIPIKIVNTGSSPALDVKITWKNNYEMIEDLMKRFNDLDIEIKCGTFLEFGADFLSFTSKGEGNAFILEPSPKTVHHILPFSNQNAETEVLIPGIFSTFTTMEVISEILSETNNKLRPLTFYAEIEYYDNINISHKELFSITYQIGSLTWAFIDKDQNIKLFDEATVTVKISSFNEKKLNLKNLHSIIKTKFKFN